MRIWLIGIGVGIGGLCVGLAAGFLIGRNTVAVPAAADSARRYPSRDEVLDYLDGKTIALAARDPSPNRLAGGHQFRRDRIEALEVEQARARINSEPWTTTVTFLLRTDDARYAVRGEVAYRWVEDRCAFTGFRVTELAEQ
jgi:hypothetical protein